MGRRVRLIVECEDALHRSFTKRFLDKIGLPEGKDPEINMRGPKGAVLNHVVEAIRAVRNANVTAHLIILVDADNWSQPVTRSQIDKRLAAAGLPVLSSADRVLLVVVGRRMDTWVRHLRGENVNEVSKPGAKLPDNSQGREGAAILAPLCLSGAALSNPLPSLSRACTDWSDYRKRHGL